MRGVAIVEGERDGFGWQPAGCYVFRSCHRYLQIAKKLKLVVELRFVHCEAIVTDRRPASRNNPVVIKNRHSADLPKRHRSPQCDSPLSLSCRHPNGDHRPPRPRTRVLTVAIRM